MENFLAILFFEKDLWIFMLNVFQLIAVKWDFLHNIETGLILTTIQYAMLSCIH